MIWATTNHYWLDPTSCRQWPSWRWASDTWAWEFMTSWDMSPTKLGSSRGQVSDATQPATEHVLDYVWMSVRQPLADHHLVKLLALTNINKGKYLVGIKYQKPPMCITGYRKTWRFITGTLQIILVQTWLNWWAAWPSKLSNCNGPWKEPERQGAKPPQKSQRKLRKLLLRFQLLSSGSGLCDCCATQP